MSNPQNILFSPPSGKLWRTLYKRKLLVGFSGGKDSLALLHYLISYASYAGWDIYACHINHRLRDGDSGRDEEFCRNWCLANSVNYSFVAVSVRESPYVRSRGVEYAARKARYDALRQEQARLGCDLILTAHTLNDQLESFFVDLITGASIYTLGGIAPELGSVIRPILGVSTEMIHEYLDHHALVPVYDSSNSNLNHVRNYVRHKLADIMDVFGSSAQGTVLRLQKESRQLNGWLAVSTREAVVYVDKHTVLIKRELFDHFSAVEKEYLLGKWISGLCRGGKAHIEAAVVQMETNASVRLSMPGQYLCEITPRYVRLFPESHVKPFEVRKHAGESCVTLPDGRVVAFPDHLKQEEFTVRSRKDGDRSEGKKLKKLFSDYKVELYDRDRAVIVERADHILWVEYLPDTLQAGIKIIMKKETAW